MKEFVSKLLSNNAIEARNILNVALAGLVQEKLSQVKMRISAELYEEVGFDLDFVTEANVQRIGRKRLIRVRVRKGKIQRRKTFSAVPGYTIRDGKMVRMSFTERRHRKMAARRAKFKRRAKLTQSLRKRKISLRKRGSMGL
jgi:hypothetical protein